MQPRIGWWDIGAQEALPFCDSPLNESIDPKIDGTLWSTSKQKAIENGPVEIVDLPMKNGDCPVRFLYVYQRVNPIKPAMNLWSNLHETIEVFLMLKLHNLFKMDFPSRTR